YTYLVTDGRTPYTVTIYAVSGEGDQISATATVTDKDGKKVDSIKDVPIATPSKPDAKPSLTPAQQQASPSAQAPASEQKQASGVKTGDSTRMNLLTTVLTVCGAVLLILGVKLRRQRREEG
ncbi:MAG: hypothetical protein U0L49_09060, partial [Eubacterium sp.]|nr:hypothetical protein [Eubacterium sp.]